MTLESFFGLDNADGQNSAEAAERFREQMRKSAAAAKAIAGHQARQKIMEDKLARIFMKFLQKNGHSDIVFLIVNLLEQNVPGALILAILMISDTDLEKDLEVDLKQKSAEGLEPIYDDTLPQNIRGELNAWGHEILTAGNLMPNRTLAAVLTPDQKLKSLVLDLLIYSLDEYFDRRAMVFDEEKIRRFALIGIQTVLVKLRESAERMSDEELMESNPAK